MSASSSTTAPSFRPQAMAGQGVPTVMSSDLSTDAFARIGFGLLVCFLFMIFSRVFDVKFSGLHLPGISSRLIMVMVLLSRAFLRALKNSIGKWLLLFTFWMVAAIPTSMWRGGSWVSTKDWFPNFIIFLATAGLIVNFQQCRKAIYTLAWAFLVLTIIARVYGSMEETGRLFLPNGKFSNPNEMAQALLLGMPLWWMILLDGTGAARKVFSGGVMFFMLVMVSKCGSRGALIAFAATALCVFMRSSLIGKLKFIVGGVVILAIVIAMMPGKLLRRYTTISEDQQEVGMMDEDYDPGMTSIAVSSAQQRKRLLLKSIKYTLRHPLFGVGPGMFSVAEDADAHTEGKRKGSWQGTHNSYTQVSSEMGIPGLIAYALVILLAVKKTSSLHSRTRRDPRLQQISNCAICLHYTLIVYAVSVFFDYIAYTSMLPVFAGLAVALDMTAPEEIERLTAGPAPAQPIPFEQFRPTWRTTAGLAPQV